MSEVIIDGCNVAECEKYHKGWCLLSKTAYGNVTEFCNENNNCEYKQLQRAKAENEKLKQALKEIKEIVNSECKKCPDGTYTEDYCNGLAYCTLAKIIEVLYKGFVLRTINEVLND